MKINIEGWILAKSLKLSQKKSLKYAKTRKGKEENYVTLSGASHADKSEISFNLSTSLYPERNSLPTVGNLSPINAIGIKCLLWAAIKDPGRVTCL
jgi:hypothetical protein